MQKLIEILRYNNTQAQKKKVTIYANLLKTLQNQEIFYDSFQEICFFFMYGNLILLQKEHELHYQDLLFYLLEKKKHNYKEWFTDKNTQNIGKIIDVMRQHSNAPVFIFPKYLPHIYDLFVTKFILLLSEKNIYKPLAACTEQEIAHYAAIVSSKEFDSYLGKPTESKGKIPLFCFLNKMIYILNVTLYHEYQQEGEICIGLELSFKHLLSHHMKKIKTMDSTKNANTAQVNNYELQTANLISITREQLVKKNKEQIEMLKLKEKQALEVININIKQQIDILETRNNLIALPYSEYLKTEYWGKIRAKTIADRKNICQDCKNKKETNQLQVHHKHYSSLGAEDIHNDLEVLCYKCHQQKTSIFSKVI